MLLRPLQENVSDMKSDFLFTEDDEDEGLGWLLLVGGIAVAGVAYAYWNWSESGEEGVR